MLRLERHVRESIAFKLALAEEGRKSAEVLTAKCSLDGGLCLHVLERTVKQSLAR